jgi:hypothetical protein
MLSGRTGGLRGLLGLGELSLSVSTPYHVVGQQFLYYVRGGPPNAQIFWSSQKDGLPTAENNAFYGHLTDGSGNADLSSTPGPDEVGNWIKTILIKDAAGTQYRAGVAYNVAAAPAQTQAQTQTQNQTQTQSQQDSGSSSSSIVDSFTSLFTGLTSDPAAQAQPIGSPIVGGIAQAVPPQPGFLSRKFSLFGFQIPYFVPLAVGAVVLLKKKR